jgi:hypothetical protein
MMDSAHIQVKDIEYLKKKALKKGYSTSIVKYGQTYQL